jgi:hypothetical protein
MPHPTPQLPWVGGAGRGGGTRGIGGLGEALGGWGIRRIPSIYYMVYTYTHICWYRTYGEEKNSKFLFSISCPTILNNSSGKINHNLTRSWLDRSSIWIPGTRYQIVPGTRSARSCQVVPGTRSCQVPNRARCLIVPGTWTPKIICH